MASSLDIRLHDIDRKFEIQSQGSAGRTAETTEVDRVDDYSSYRDAAHWLARCKCCFSGRSLHSDWICTTVCDPYGCR
ncbi:hypothetical protein D3C71_1815480 [compost metagenome]